MKRPNKITILAFIVLVAVMLIVLLRPFTVTSISQPDLYNLKDNDTTQLKFKDAILNLEVARSEAKQQQGFMNRSVLDQDSGMIFIFDIESPVTFWMKDTFISLDIIYLNKDLKVVNIYHSTLTNQTTTLYPSLQPTQFVIEANSGWSDQHGLKIGDQFQKV